MKDIINKEDMLWYVEIKTKQWYRTPKGVINQILGSSGKYKNDYGIIAVADTPQELIQEKDLIYIDGNTIEVICVYSNGAIETIDAEVANHYIKEVTKILTPNSSGGYDLQWEEE